jgi:glycosyltransferase involved in cell wall biosynthesis
MAISLRGVAPRIGKRERDMTRFDPAMISPPKTLLHAFPTFEVGGSQIRFAALANHHGGRYHHLIVAMDGKTGCLDRLGKNVSYEVLKVDAPKGKTINNFFAYRRVLAETKPDTLITYNWGAIEWALANVIPICRQIHIEDGFGSDEAVSGQLRRRSVFRRMVLSWGTQVVLPSRTLLNIASDVWRLPPRRLIYIPNGIDSARFASDPDPELAASLRRRPDELLIGTVAALRTEKNIGRLIEAFATIAAVRPARLIIVGDGAEREMLQQLADGCGVGDNVVFTGAMPNPERIIGAFDVFALSSNTEQMPFSILEAMAAGLPIASVDVGDVREMLAPENWPFVAGLSAGELAHSLSGLLCDPDLRAKIGRGNLARVRDHYDQAKMFASYGALFDA